MKKLKYLFLLSIAFVTTITLNTFAESKSTNERAFITDQADLFNKEELDNLNNLLVGIQGAKNKETGEVAGIQYAIITTKSLNDQSIEEWSLKKFNSLGIGYKETNLGILFVIAPSEREYRLQLGKGFDGTDINESTIEQYVYGEELTEELRDENYYQAVLMITQKMFGLLGEKYEVNDQGKSFTEGIEREKSENEEAENGELGEGDNEVITDDYANTDELFGSRSMLGSFKNVIFVLLLLGGGFLGTFFARRHFQRKKMKQRVQDYFQLDGAFNWVTENYGVPTEKLMEKMIRFCEVKKAWHFPVERFLKEYTARNCIENAFLEDVKNREEAYLTSAKEVVAEISSVSSSTYQDFTKDKTEWTRKEVQQYAETLGKEWFDIKKKNLQVIGEVLADLLDDSGDVGFNRYFKRLVETRMDMKRRVTEKMVVDFYSENFEIEYIKEKIRNNPELDLKKYDMDRVARQVRKSRKFHFDDYYYNRSEIGLYDFLIYHSILNSACYTDAYLNEINRSDNTFGGGGSDGFGGDFGGGSSSGGGASGSW